MKNTVRSLVLIAFASLLSVGCSAEGSLCDFKCDCEGCSDHAHDNCLAEYDDDYRAADRRGCTDLYDDLIACQEDTAHCSGDHFETDCGREKDDLKKCID